MKNSDDQTDKSILEDRTNKSMMLKDLEDRTNKLIDDDNDKMND